MRKLKIYLDTSVINHLFHEEVPERQSATLEFLSQSLSSREQELYVSFLVVRELRRTQDSQRRESLLGAVQHYSLRIIGIDSLVAEARTLALLYLRRGILPSTAHVDAFHVALATVHEIDVLVSWNYRHLVNVKKELHFQAANIEAGYMKLLRIRTPLEVMS